MKITIEVVSGKEGKSLYIDGWRVAGSKPWGGGSVVASFTADFEYLKRALSKLEIQLKPENKK